MVDPRNTFRRAANSPRVTATAALGCATVALLVACSSDAITSPARVVAPGALAAGKGAPDPKADPKAEPKAAHDLAKAEFDSLKADWEAYKRAVQQGVVKAEVLRCEPQQIKAVTKKIGSKGGTLDVGPHRLVIPAGALPGDVEITGDAPTGPEADLEFQPHGLQFQRPVEMTFDYGRCVVPTVPEADVELGVTYMGPVGAERRAIEKMPSTDKRDDHKISALTDHFSGFVITWGVRAP